MSSANISSIVLAANELNYIGMMFIRCFCYILIPVGTMGHLLSIYVFTRPNLRSNPCSRYFLATTFIGLLHTMYVVPIRMVQSAFINTDPGAYSNIFCKLVWFSLNSLRYVDFPDKIRFLRMFFCRGLGYWMIVLACADRYLCSHPSVTIRAWSSIRVANRLIPLTVLLGFVAYVHVPIFFKIEIIPATQKPICYPPGPPGTYRIVLSYFHLIYFGLSPSFSMLLFGMLTLQNIERSKRVAAGPSTSSGIATSQITRKINRQMFRMLLVQVLVYCVTGLTFSIAIIITSISASQTKNIFQIAQENMVNAVVGMFSTLGPCVSFYLFTLSSSLFRKELKHLFYKVTCIDDQPIQGQQSLDTFRSTREGPMTGGSGK